MDPILFDRLTKSLAAVGSRRRALRLAAGLLGGTMIAGLRPTTAFACGAGQCFFPFPGGGACGDCSGCTGDGVCIQSDTCMHCNGPCEPRNDGLVGCGAGQPNCVNNSVSCTLDSGARACCGCPDGFVSCQDKCVQKCDGGQTLNPTTCACECSGGKTKCGVFCTDATAMCCDPAGNNGVGRYCVLATDGACCGAGCCAIGSCGRGGTRCGGKQWCGSRWLGKNEVCCTTKSGKVPCAKGHCKKGSCTKLSGTAQSATGETPAAPRNAGQIHAEPTNIAAGSPAKSIQRSKADRKRSSGDGGASGRSASAGT